MKNQMTSHDYELISAYMDNQLSARDRAIFENRLKADPELRKELNEISRTRQLIHSLPKLRAPRNYYVKAEAVPARPTTRLAPVFGIVSAVASILLVLVIFGSTFFEPHQPVAMAPAAPKVQATLTVQQEVQRSSVSPEPTMEAAPLVMMTSPLQASPTIEILPTEAGPTQPPTPTTVYMYAYLPTSTPEGVAILGQEQIESSQLQCEQYYGTGTYPTLTTQFDCPTPTASSTPTPTATPTSPPLSLQSLSLASPTATETPTETSTPTATPTETPTASATPTFTPSPSPTEMPPASEKVLPTSVAESPAGLTAPNPVLGAGASTPSAQDQGANPNLNPNGSFLNYLLLSIEISLAVIAVIAGVFAILFRIRAGR